MDPNLHAQTADHAKVRRLLKRVQMEDKHSQPDLQGIIFPVFSFCVIGMAILHVIRTAWFSADLLVLWTWVPMHTPFSLTLADLVVLIVFFTAALLGLVSCVERKLGRGLRGALLFFCCLMVAYVLVVDSIGDSMIEQYEEVYELHGDRDDLIGYDAAAIGTALKIIKDEKR